MPQQQPTPQPTTPDNNLPKPQPPMKVPLVEEEQQGDTISPLRVPEENPKTNLLPTILTQESTTKSSNQMKEKEADTKEALITFQNTTRPAARNKRKRKVKSNKKKQQQPKTILQTIAHVAYHSNTFNPDTRQIAQYFELSRCSEGHLWVESCEDEFGRLMDGNGEKIKQGRNNEIHPRTQYPTRKIRNTSTNCDSFLPWKRKSTPNTVHWRGNLVIYPGKTSTKAADITTVKLLINSTLSTPNARFITADIANFYHR